MIKTGKEQPTGFTINQYIMYNDNIYNMCITIKHIKGIIPAHELKNIEHNKKTYNNNMYNICITNVDEILSI